MMRSAPPDKRSGTRTALVFLLLGLLGGSISCGSLARDICEKTKECASDPPGEDFVQVCVISYQGEVDAYRANKEDACIQLAEAKLVFDGCRAELDCDNFSAGDLGGECADELEVYTEAFADAGGECSPLD